VGILFRSTEKIKADRKDLQQLETYDELYDAIIKACKA
jgi:hypothetical protein